MNYDHYGYPIFAGDRGYSSCGGDVDRYKKEMQPMNIEASQRLVDLINKVRYGYNLLNSEARYVFAHYGVTIAEPPKRCSACGGDGLAPPGHGDGTSCWYPSCEVCRGTGYEVEV